MADLSSGSETLEHLPAPRATTIKLIAINAQGLTSFGTSARTGRVADITDADIARHCPAASPKPVTRYRSNRCGQLAIQKCFARHQMGCRESTRFKRHRDGRLSTARALLSADELARLTKALVSSPTRYVPTPFRLLLLSGCRKK